MVYLDFFFFSARYSSQNLMHARQPLLSLSYLPNSQYFLHFTFLYFELATAQIKGNIGSRTWQFDLVPDPGFFFKFHLRKIKTVTIKLMYFSSTYYVLAL